MDSLTALCCIVRGIADLVSKAVQLEAESDPNLKVRRIAGAEDTLSRALTGRAVQESQDAKRLLGHVDRKLVKQARSFVATQQAFGG